MSVRKSSEPSACLWDAESLACARGSESASEPRPQGSASSKLFFKPRCPGSRFSSLPPLFRVDPFLPWAPRTKNLRLTFEVDDIPRRFCWLERSLENLDFDRI